MEAMRCVAMKKQFPIISFEHASFQYEGQSQESLKDVKLIIKSGEFLVITGQSGCGKTTLTRCINNLIPRFFEGRLSGEVIVLGRSIKESDAGEAGKEIASIFQDPRSQFFTTNSSSEVAFACENYGIPHKEIVKRVNSAFQSLNMENLKDRDIFALSSGERQKVAFLAATTLNPQIYVLDEPSANLDIHTILQVREILSALKAAGHTIIVSEHRLFYLYGLADRFLIMEDGQICEELTGEEMAELSAVQMHNRRLRPLNLDLIQIERKESICRSEVFLQIRNLSFSHKAMPELLHNISLEAYKGETIALIGENGCGKTTLGKILSGLIRCRQGAFYIDGKNVKQQKLSDYVYFVMQEADHQLYTDSVTEELRLGNKRIPSIDEKVSQILKMLHLENFKDCHPYALSGGQKQRLTIGAAMLSEKPIIVLDEPTSGLDWDNMCAVANAVNYMREAGKLVFIITHDLEFISLTASRALLLKEGIIKDDLQMTEQNNFKIVKNFMVVNKLRKHGVYYDSRIKLLLILLTSALAFALGGGLTGLLLFGVVCLFALLSGLWKTSIKVAIVYIVLLMLAQVLPIHLSSVITFFLLRILTIALALNILFQTTEISELIAALQASHIPQAIVIPVAIILRFLPSLKQDVLYIKQGMKTRGVGLSFWRIVSHPAQTYEGFLVPILMRLLMTATELSASAETRGISYPCEKTHYILVDFRLRDSILLIGMLALFAVIIWTSFQPISF